MIQENLPKVEEQYNPNLEAQDEEVLSGGNNRLMYVLAAVLVALVVGYLLLPKGTGGGVASVTPSFMLDDAAVTATAPTSADSIAAGLKSATVATDEPTEEAAATKPSDKPAAPQKTAAALASTAALVAPAADAPVQAQAPEPEPTEVAAPAPEPAAPANVTLTGRIQDENGRPMAGATVLLKGSSKGTSTDANGSYALEVPSGSDHSLIFGYGGYEDEVLHVSGTRPVNVTLTPRAKSGRQRR